MGIETVNYKEMQVGEEAQMPVLEKWEGANQALFHEIQDWCGAQDPRPQFEVETLRIAPTQQAPGRIEYWIKRTR